MGKVPSSERLELHMFVPFQSLAPSPLEGSCNMKVTRSTHFAKGKRGNKNVKRQRNEGRREAQRKRQKKQ
eukprot:3996246-Amphidinium_carterae.1